MDTRVPGEGLEVLVFVGYPGCGKSQLANKLARDHGYEIVNRDTLKTWQKCVENAKILLKRKQSVIVDNTNGDVQSRYLNFTFFSPFYLSNFVGGYNFSRFFLSRCDTYCL